jgi:pimeloyl-ACP methyl ester carboxylesterase
MNISKNQRVIFKRVLWAFIPPILLFVVGVVLLEGYVVYRLTQPARSPLYASPRDFQVILQKPSWTDEKWRNSDNTQSVGWFLTQTKPSPTIIISHGYGENRSEFLTLCFELWKAGYNVLLYDLRGHGESPVNWSGLGMYEKEDLLSAINYVRTLKDPSGALIGDGRIGLYGVEIGGYSSILAASQSPLVKAVALDSVYPDIPTYIKYRLKAGAGNDNPWARLIDYPATGQLTSLALQVYLTRRDDSETAEDALRSSFGRRFLFIVGPDSGPLGNMTKALYQRANTQKELAEVNKTRLGRLYEKDSADYDARVVSFFQEALPATPGPLTPGAPAATAGTAGPKAKRSPNAG